MNTKGFLTVEQIDSRLVWVNKEIQIAFRKSLDRTESLATRQRAESRCKNLRHEKKVLLKYRSYLQTPAML